MSILAGLSWAMWLAAPMAATLLGALVLWWRGRAEREPASLPTRRSISGHQAYLDALRPRRPITGVGAEETQDLPG